MKIKKSRQIIFETREIRRIHIVRRQRALVFLAPPEIQDDSFSIEKRLRFKARIGEKLRGFWKRNHRRLKDKIQKSEVSLMENKEDK